MTKPSVVIVGGGFAGVGCAKELGKHDVPSRCWTSTTTTSSSRCCTRSRRPSSPRPDVARPLRAIFKKSTSVDVKRADGHRGRSCHADRHDDDGQTFTGDYLVLAAGSRPNFFNTPGRRASTPFRSTPSTTPTRCARGCSEVVRGGRRRPRLASTQGALNIVIVGAGPTGVETAGAVADLVNQVIPKRFHDLDVKRTRIYLVDHGPVVLAAFSDKAHEYAADKLRAQRRDPASSAPASPRSRRQGHAERRHEIPTRAVVWAGGIQAPELAGKLGLAQGRGGRLTVEPDLTVEAFPASTRSATWPTSPTTTATTFRSSDRSPCRPAAGRQEHPRRHRRQAAEAVPLPGQGDHGDDRRRRGDRRDGCPPPRAARPCRVRGVARCARLADERRAPARRRLRLLGVGLPRLEPVRARSSTAPNRPDRLGRRAEDRETDESRREHGRSET